MKWNAKIAIACAMLVILVAISRVVIRSDSGKTKATYSQFIEQVRSGEVAGVVVRASRSGASQAFYRLKDGRSERTVLPGNYKDAMTAMEDARVNLEIEDPSSEWLTLLINASPFLLLLGFWVIMMLRFPNHLKLGNTG
jgi:cell division protease FtsH